MLENTIQTCLLPRAFFWPDVRNTGYPSDATGTGVILTGVTDNIFNL